jgi:hypothetical protein
MSQIEKLLPAQSIPYLKEMPIWFEFANKNGLNLQFHNSAEWLSHHGWDPRKESSIEILVTDYASMPHDSLPLLYLLCRAYHNRVLGDKNSDIKETYDHAKTIQGYLIKYGKKKWFPFRRDLEYFGTISAAYFGGKLSVPPYNKEQLKQIDPNGYALVEKLWKIK